MGIMLNYCTATSLHSGNLNISIKILLKKG